MPATTPQKRPQAEQNEKGASRLRHDDDDTAGGEAADVPDEAAGELGEIELKQIIRCAGAVVGPDVKPAEISADERGPVQQVKDLAHLTREAAGADGDATAEGESRTRSGVKHEQVVCSGSDTGECIDKGVVTCAADRIAAEGGVDGAVVVSVLNVEEHCGARLQVVNGLS